jgi:hypothetical protein
VFAGSNGINIATAGVNVTLRGLTINGMGGNYGIYMTDGASLTVQDCLVSNFTNSQKAGVAIISTSSSTINVSIADTTS